MREIVAARLGAFVTNNPATIQMMLQEQPNSVEFFDRDFARRMAYIIGSHWEGIAVGAALFLVDEQGEPHEPAPAASTEK